MKRAAYFVFLAILFLPGTSKASDLYVVSAPQDKTSLEYADASSIRKANGLVRMWITTVYNPNIVQDNGAVYYKALDEYDCAAQTYKILAIAFYRANGDVIGDEAPPAYSAPAFVVPDSIAADELAFACGDPATRDAALRVRAGADVVSETASYFAATKPSSRAAR